jgi:DNA helicase HerA-like ATPase
MIPGQPHADYGHRRSLETAALAAGMPAASAVVGHRHGFPIGVTTRTATRAVTLHPWHATETLNHSALIAVLGAPGAGKSTLAGLLMYMAARAGIRSVVLDPSGLLDRLCALPELAAASLAANLLDGEPGILCPYRLIGDPAPGTPRLEQQLRAAAVARRALVADILRMLLPVRVQGEATEFALAEAVRKAPSTVSSSPQQVIAALRSLDRESLADRGALLAGILSDLSEHPLARLFFPAGDAADSGAAGRGRVLTVLTLRGLVLPGAARRPEERTVEEQLSIPIVHLAAQLLRRLLLDLPREDRKLAVLDEAHMITGDPAGRKAVNELARDGRKTNTCVTVISHNAADLLAAGLAGLIGAVFAFRTEHPQEQAATLDLLGLPRGAGHEQLLGELSREARAGSGATGECLLRDGGGGIEQVQVDLGGHLGLRAALDSTPGRRSPRAAAAPARRRPVVVAR